MEQNDPRVTVPIFTPQQVGWIAGMPASTVYSWMRETPTRPALIHSLHPHSRGWPSIPLIGAAEAKAMRAMRTGGMSMRGVVEAVGFLRKQGGPYTLANPRLLHDGFIALIRERQEYATIDGQGVIGAAVQRELRPFTLAADGFVEALQGSMIPETEFDPRFVTGRLRFTKTGVPVFAVAGALRAGDPPEAVANDYGVELRLVRAVQSADPDWLAAVA